MNRESVIQKIDAYTSNFTPITLKDTGTIELMDRYDTKYLFSRNILEGLLQECIDSYYVVKEKGYTVFPYKNIYIDTAKNDMFLAHQNGKLHRFKVRLREYEGFNLVFFEIKEKYKGKTQKVRIQLANSTSLEDCLLDQDTVNTMSNFLQEHSPYALYQLQPAVRNSFLRITLVHKSKTERLTLDTFLHNSWKGKDIATPQIVIAEVKHQQGQPVYTFELLLKTLGIRPGSYSKYCIGSLQTHAAEKYNTFKETLLKMEKLQYE